jgi:hypothetical protein
MLSVFRAAPIRRARMAALPWPRSFPAGAGISHQYGTSGPSVEKEYISGEFISKEKGVPYDGFMPVEFLYIR